MKSTIEQRNPFRNWHESQQCFGHYSTDETGLEISAKNPRACRWCALGWLKFMSVDPQLVALFNQWCADTLGGKSVAELNDVDGWSPKTFEAAWNRFMKEAIESSMHSTF